jgi:hypothetical protein
MEQLRDEPLALGSGHLLLPAPSLDVPEGTGQLPEDAQSGELCQLILVREAGAPAAPPPQIGYPSADTPFRVVAEAGWEDGGDAVALLLAPLVVAPPDELEVVWPEGAVSVPLPSPWRRRLSAAGVAPA